MSRLPEAFESRTIAGMSPGDKGYTVPWAMFADEDRILWINGGHSVMKEPKGTAHLEIQRTKDGVIVYEDSIGDHTYGIGDSEYFGGVKVKLPVTLE